LPAVGKATSKPPDRNIFSIRYLKDSERTPSACEARPIGRESGRTRRQTLESDEFFGTSSRAIAR
jgi:hypothetical protein